MISAPAVQILEGRCGDVTVLRLLGPVNDTGLMVRLAQQLLDARIDGGHVVLDRRLFRTCGAGPAGLVCFPSVEAAAEVARPPISSS